MARSTGDGVGVNLNEGEMCSVAEVKRMSDIIMSLKLDIKGMV